MKRSFVLSAGDVVMNRAFLAFGHYTGQTTDERSVAFFRVLIDKKTDLTKLFGKASGLTDYA